jgi:hypothetical protein
MTGNFFSVSPSWFPGFRIEILPMNTTTTTNESNESPSEPTACAGTCGGVYARGTEMVLLWQRHATAQGLVTRQDAFCFRCALQDLSDQIQKLKAEIRKQKEAQAATMPLSDA